MYDCEIEGCANKTDGYLCEFHVREAFRDEKKIVVCEKCDKIIQILDRPNGAPKYDIVKDCMVCRLNEQRGL